MDESAIAYDTGAYWVRTDKSYYTVCQSGLTHSVTLVSFEKSADGLSLAKAYCDYKSKHTAPEEGAHL